MKQLLIVLGCVFSISILAQTPQVSWGMQLGQSVNANRWGKVVENDAVGNVYCAGTFEGTIDLDPTSGTDAFTSFGDADIYIAKYDEDRTYLWGFSVAAGGEIVCNDIAVESNGDFVITGRFNGQADFDPSSNVFTLFGNSFPGSYDAFVAKYDANGQLLWAFNLGNVSYITCEGNAIDFDQAGCVYVTGMVYAGGVDFDPDTNATNILVGNSSTIFIAKYSPTGQHIFAFGYTGSPPQYSFGTDLQVAYNGTFGVIGHFNGNVNVDPLGTTNMHNANSSFVASYDTTGVLNWFNEVPYSPRSFDNYNNCLFVAGEFNDTIDIDPGTGTFDLISCSAWSDICIVWYDSLGGSFFGFSFGGIDNELAYGFEVDRYGHMYISGSYWDSMDVAPGPGVYNLPNGNPMDGSNIFIARYQRLGYLDWAFGIGEVNSWDNGFGLSVLGESIYTTGNFYLPMDIDPNSGVQTLTPTGTASDAFVVRYIQDTTLAVEEPARVFKSECYPNPTTSKVKLVIPDGKEYYYDITDETGKQVSPVARSQSILELDFSSYAEGIYFVNVTFFDSGEEFSSKVIVAH